MTILLMVAAVLFGAFGYMNLPVAELPQVDFPTISVSASLPGADPETMASAVATPLENQFSTIAGIDSMTSTSSLGATNIVLQFKLDRDIDAAALDVQTAISGALRQLPDEMPTPPTFRKVNPADAPIIQIGLSSPNLPLSVVDEYAESILARRLSTIEGVAQINVFGGQQYAVRLQFDPDALTARGIGIDEVASAIQTANSNNPAGSLSGSKRMTVIRANGQLVNADAFRRQIIAWRNGAPVRIGDVGTATDSVADNKRANWLNGKRSIALAIQRQPGANTIAIADAVNKILPEFQRQLPAGIAVETIFDRSTSIRASVHDVQLTLGIAAILVVLVIFLFLRTLSATIIPSLALPIALIGTFAGMAYLGFSLNNLSLMALTLSVGFVVDDAIVMLENIMRHIEDGEKPFDAAVKGSREIGFTIISMTASLAAVFIPVLFMGGIVGRLLHEFAVTIVLAIVVSGIVSVTLTPLLCARLIRQGSSSHGREHGAILRWSERVFDRTLALYEKSLHASMARHRMIFLVFVASLVLSALFFQYIPKDFMPSGDTGQLSITTEGPNGISFKDMAAHQQRLAAIVLADPNIDKLTSAVGASGQRASLNTGNMFITLKPRSDRNLTADEIIQELRPKLAKVPGIKAYLQNPPSIRIGGRASKGSYQYTLQDVDLKTLYANADKLEKALAQQPNFQDVTSDLDLTTPTLNIEIDRDRAASLGITPQQIQTALSSSFGGVQVSTIYTSSDQYDVMMEVEDKYSADASGLEHIFLRSSTTGGLIPLTAVTKISRIATALTVNHQGQLPAVTLSFNLAPGVALSQAVSIIENVQSEIGLSDSVITSFQGTAQAFQQSMSGLGILLAIGILVVYLVLGILYESFIHPLTILSGLPSAAVGGLFTLFIFGVPLSLYAFVGLILLIGLVKKNAIMMIDFALERERNEGMAPADAIVEAALLRFRPIMMTTLAAFMGTLPIAIGIGEGGETRQPLGLVVVGGLALSQLLTLYITPVLYVYLDQAGTWVRNRRTRSQSAPSPGE